MIHIATVHWQTDKWIDIQKKHLDKFIKEEFRVYSFLNGIDQKHASKFYYISYENIREHYIKLNILGEIIKLSSNDENDLIFFLDGDAFPVGDIVGFVRDKISKHQLIAIQRIENNGDIQPHPSFCATTIGFWNNINGDWSYGYTWKNNQGKKVTDVGGELLKKLLENEVDWYPIHRTDELIIDPLRFGIYDGVVYHHGSGFWESLGRVVYRNEGIEKVQRNFISRIFNKIPNDLIIQIKNRLHPEKRFIRKISEKYKTIDESVFQLIKEKDPFNVG